jgi:hypothetical protein
MRVRGIGTYALAVRYGFVVPWPLLSVNVDVTPPTNVVADDRLGEVIASNLVRPAIASDADWRSPVEHRCPDLSDEPALHIVGAERKVLLESTPVEHAVLEPGFANTESGAEAESDTAKQASPIDARAVSQGALRLRPLAVQAAASLMNGAVLELGPHHAEAEFV